MGHSSVDSGTPELDGCNLGWEQGDLERLIAVILQGKMELCLWRIVGQCQQGCGNNTNRTTSDFDKFWQVWLYHAQASPIATLPLTRIHCDGWQDHSKCKPLNCPFRNTLYSNYTPCHSVWNTLQIPGMYHVGKYLLYHTQFGDRGIGADEAANLTPVCNCLSLLVGVVLRSRTWRVVV
jgi:hypothetical protein